MPIGALTDALIIVGGTTLSDHVTKITCEDNRNPVDVTAMGASNITFIKGLGDGKVTIDFLQDFSGGKTHATLQPLIGSTSTFVLEIRPTSAARSATNPALLMTSLLFNYNFLDGSVGDASAMTAEFQNAAQAGITYVTA